MHSRFVQENMRYSYGYFPQSNEVANSNRMEHEGLVRGLREVEGQTGDKVAQLITDRHPESRKWLKEQRNDITHYFDIWHVAKSEYPVLLFVFKTLSA